MNITKLNIAENLWMVSGETNSYIIVRNNKSLMIDCGAVRISALLGKMRIPQPSVILHTQVQDEHCKEWHDLKEADVYIHSEDKEMAILSDLFYEDCKTIWGPSREWDTRGEEKYGVAGAITVRPPKRPLNITGTLSPAEQFHWEGIVFDIINLPASGKHSLGFFWKEEKLFFSGDLIKKGGYVVNFYDLERSYGIPSAFEDLKKSLEKVNQISPQKLLPTTGEIIDQPLQDIEKLQERILWINVPKFIHKDKIAATVNYTPKKEFGRYRQVAEGIYQNNNAGNMILFVDKQGRGMIIDPDPCVWLDWEENCRQINADFDLLEKETNLKTVELILATHYHGDHVEYTDLLRKRYGAKLMATSDVAEIIEQPEKFPYPAQVNWYGFPFLSISVDKKIKYDEISYWNDIPITPIHTPGHCNAHAGFLIKYNDIKIICTGDVLMYGDGPVYIPLPVIYNDTAWPDRGYFQTYQKIAKLKPYLILGGHSFSFFDSDGTIMKTFCDAAEESLNNAMNMIDDKSNLLSAMTPPGYDKIRPV